MPLPPASITFIRDIYRDLLGKAPTPQVISDLSSKMMSQEQVAETIIASPEFKSASLSDKAFVDLLYANMLNRAPDTQGEAFWIKYLADNGGQNSNTRAVVATVFENSAEGATRDNLQIFSPYSDMTLGVGGQTDTMALAAGAPDVTLAFIVSDAKTPNTLAWGGVIPVSNDVVWNGKANVSIATIVSNLQAAGGHPTISFGGANGSEAATQFKDAASLTAAYQAVLDKYKVSSIDFDIEGQALTNTAANTLRDQALIALEKANPGLSVSYTLPVLQTGLDGNGTAILKQAVKDGLRIDKVNIMAMDYGPAVADMGQASIDAATATIQQLKDIGLKAKVGVTPMIGVNDTPGETFTLANATALEQWAANHSSDVASLGMWSLARDNGSTAGSPWASPTGSGLAQPDWAFSHILGLV